MRKIIVLSSLLLLSVNSVFSQVQHDSKLRFIRNQALLIVDAYELNCALGNNYEVDDFNNKFEKGATINNDVLPANSLNQITLTEYGDLLYKYHQDPIYADVRAYRAIVEEGDLQDGGKDVGIVYVDAWKHIESISRNGYSYNDTIDIRFTIAYNKTDTVFKITNIEQNQPYGKYVVIGITNKKDGKQKAYSSDLQRVVINNDTITLNSNGEVFRKNVQSNLDIQIEPVSDEYFQTKRVQFNYDKIGPDDEARSNYRQVYFRKKRFFIRPSIAIFSNKKDLVLDGNKTYAADRNAIGSTFGIEFGLNIFSFKKVPITIGLLVGGKYTLANYSFTAPLFRETYGAIDSDGDVYNRTSTIKDLSEEGNYSFLQIPLTLRIDYKFNSLWGAYAGIGYSYALQRELPYTSSAFGDYYGTYGPEYYNIVLNENGVNDFGQYDLNAKGDVVGNEPMGMLKFDLGAFFSINKRLYGEMGFSYWYGLDPMFKNTEHLSGNYNELNSSYQKAVDNSLKVINFEIGLKYYL